MLIHNIREKCKQKGMTIKALEQNAEITPNSIFRWDAVMPAADKLARVATVLGTTVEELLQE